MNCQEALIQIAKGRAVYSEVMGLTIFRHHQNPDLFAVVPRIGNKNRILDIVIHNALVLPPFVEDWILSGPGSIQA